MFDFILNLIFPKRCIGCNKFGSYICASCFSYISFDTVPICPVCNKNSIDGRVHSFCKTSYCLDGLTSGVVYKGIVKKLVYKFKYKPYVYDLGKTISELLYEALSQNEVFYNILKTKPMIITVPLHKDRERQRGYNHAKLIADYISQCFKLEMFDGILLRTRKTKPQFKLERKDRIKNIKGAFIINQDLKQKIRNKSVILVDDLATTCITLNECAKVLRRNGAKSIWGITFARES